MAAYNVLRFPSGGTSFVLFLGLVFFLAAVHAQFIVDCSGANSNAFPSITAALQQAPLGGSAILVTGTCSETVNVYGMIGLNLGAPYGQTSRSSSADDAREARACGGVPHCARFSACS